MSELELIRTSQQGSISSFTQLVERYQPRLSGYLLAHNQIREEVEDIVQETFLNAFRHIKSYNQKWQFSTWIYTIARRIASKKSSPYQQQNFDDSIKYSEKIAEQLKIESPLKNIWVLIRPSMKDDEFDSLWFYFSQNLPIKDIAKILDKSESWVKVSLHRSKKKLSSLPSIQQLFRELEENSELW